MNYGTAKIFLKEKIREDEAFNEIPPKIDCWYLQAEVACLLIY